MTELEIRIALAEVAGMKGPWTTYHDIIEIDESSDRFNHEGKRLPELTLDWVHEIENKKLLGQVGWVHYSYVLLRGNIHATKEQRAEAILRTLGKWVE